ncbi:MAG: HEAT repeat domain-containing protein, partial [Chloroflexota bacterium]
MALGLLGGKRAIGSLTSALEDGDNQVRSAAKEAIARIENPDAFKIESRRNGEGSEKVFGDLIDIGEDWFKGENGKE